MDIESFCETSKMAEQWLLNLGVVVRDESTGEVLRQCSGESLYSICIDFRYISQEFSDQVLSDAIILAAGDRTTKYVGPLGDCWGVTSHDAAGTVVYNIGYRHCLKVWNAIRKPTSGLWPQWNDLTPASRRKVAEIERAHCAPTTGISELHSAVRTERIMYLKTQKPAWVPTDAQIQRVKDAIAGMKYKTTNLDAIRVAAKMKKQSVSVILKLIDHKAE